MLSILKNNGLIEAKTIGEEEAKKAGFLFARAESIVPSPESAHAIAYSIKLAKQLEKTREESTVVFNLLGHGLFDLSFYS